jgi:hypothetical protein
MLMTPEAWIERARLAAEPQDKLACLVSAESVALQSDAFCTIAQAYLELTEDGAARRCLASALDCVDGETSRTKVAEIFGARLEDLVTAREVLELEQAAIAASPGAVGWDWARLAEAYLRILGDRDAAKQTLERGRAGATTAGTLVTIATTYKEALDDEASARDLLGQAEARAQVAVDRFTNHHDISDYRMILCAYRDPLNDMESARAVLDRGLARADGVESCTRLAAAWAGGRTASPADEEVSRCLRKAEDLARTASDWLVLAKGHFESARDHVAARRYLERANGANPSDDDLDGIAFGFRHWLDDDVGADAIAPHGYSPADIMAKRRDLDGFSSDPAGLLTWLRARLTQDAIESIAGADYGCDFAAHLRELSDIRQSGRVPHPLQWEPREVLALYRWRERHEADHVARAFACALLAIDSSGPRRRVDTPEEVFPVLLESCIELGSEAMDLAEGFFAAIVEAAPDRDRAFATFALLLVTAARVPDDPRLDDLTNVVIQLEAEAPDDRPEAGWLFRTTFHDIRRSLWVSLTHDIIGRAVETHRGLPHLREILQRVPRETTKQQ